MPLDCPNWRLSAICFSSTRGYRSGLTTKVSLISDHRAEPEASPPSGRRIIAHGAAVRRNRGSPSQNTTSPEGAEEKPRNVEWLYFESHEASKGVSPGSALPVPPWLMGRKGLNLSNNVRPALIWTAQRHAVPAGLNRPMEHGQQHAYEVTRIKPTAPGSS
jgi:hypothetical protein